jgi:hypothetical protein
MATLNLKAATSVVGDVTTTQLASGANTLYTVAAGKAVIVKKMVLTNTSASPVIVTVNVVKSGGSVGASNEVIHAFSLEAADTYIVGEVEGAALNEGDSIRVNAAAAASVTAFLDSLLLA